MMQIIQEILSNIGLDNSRFQLIDHEHILDTSTQLKFHLYDDKPFAITLKGDPIAEMRDFNQLEREEFQKVKNKLSDTLTDKGRKKLMEIYRSV